MSKKHSRLGDVFVWLALVALVALNYGLSKVDFGGGGVWIAIAIGLIETLLIATFYMGLREQPGARRFTLPAALLFLLLLIGLTLGDVVTRWPPDTPRWAEHTTPKELRPEPTRTSTHYLFGPGSERLKGQ